MKTKRAFTLIELLIVVGIIAILAALAIPNMIEAQVRAKVARTKSDLRTVATALESYAVDWNKYPPDFDSGIYGPVAANERLTFNSLTTPVAFLTTKVTDIFRPDPDEISKGVYLEYWGEDAVVNANPNSANAAMWRATDTHWVVYSVGPDRGDQHLGGNVLDSSRLYDATNGTISLGDVGRSSARTLP